MLQSRSGQSILTIVPDDHEYVIPDKAVKCPADMQIWEKSEAYHEYLGFILAINEAVKGKSFSVDCNMSEMTKNIIELLNELDKLIDDVKPIEQPQRFGNQAFRTWYKILKENALTMIQGALPETHHRAVPEIAPYLVDGFGNSTRIDYGTGHEISFLMFLCCLFKIGCFTEQDKVAVGCKVFSKYLDVVRKLQQTYRMEPAGSHGVWSLDDFQFVPFIFGSAQLMAHPKIEPSSFLNQNILSEYSKEYLFLGCIDNINKVKKGPFAEHSNQLWGISGVSNWTKVNQGLIKMYKVEVLGKFPVVQHIVFGSLLQFRLVPPASNSSIEKLKLRPSLSKPVPSNVTSPAPEERVIHEASSVTEEASVRTDINEEEISPPSG